MLNLDEVIDLKANSKTKRQLQHNPEAFPKESYPELYVPLEIAQQAVDIANAKTESIKNLNEAQLAINELLRQRIATANQLLNNLHYDLVGHCSGYYHCKCSSYGALKTTYEELREVLK